MYSTYVTKFLLAPYPFNYSCRSTTSFLFLYLSPIYSRFRDFLKNKVSFASALFFVYFYVFFILYDIFRNFMYERPNLPYLPFSALYSIIR